MRVACLLFLALGLSASPGSVTTFELVIDSGTADLAAWQVELSFDAESARILRIDSAVGFPTDIPLAFDHAGLSGGRLTLLAISTSTALPTGITSVARVQIFHRGDPQLSVRPIAAANSAAQRIPITLALTPHPELTP
ncbi:MAG: hypothetical protein ACI8W8_002846 [Rhodothermales bacterium]|jgi:hypothetical protein